MLDFMAAGTVGFICEHLADADEDAAFDESFSIIAAIVIVPMMMSNLHNNIVNHILFLFPYLALDANNFFDMAMCEL